MNFGKSNASDLDVFSRESGEIFDEMLPITEEELKCIKE